MARPYGSGRKVKSPEEMEKLWDEYKQWCDTQTITKTEFSSRLGEFITAQIPASITYTIIGFCGYIDLTLSAFYDTYKNDPDYSEIVSRMERDCEIDVRRKFEVGAIPTNLAALWMSKHGYSTKNEQEIKGNVPVVIAGEDDLSE